LTLQVRAIGIYPAGARTITLWHVGDPHTVQPYRVEDSDGSVRLFATLSDAAAFAMRRAGNARRAANAEGNTTPEVTP